MPAARGAMTGAPSVEAQTAAVGIVQAATVQVVIAQAATAQVETVQVETEAGATPTPDATAPEATATAMTTGPRGGIEATATSEVATGSMAVTAEEGVVDVTEALAADATGAVSRRRNHHLSTSRVRLRQT